MFFIDGHFELGLLYLLANLVEVLQPHLLAWKMRRPQISLVLLCLGSYPFLKASLRDPIIV